MSIRVGCSSCGKKLQVRDELAGKKVKCPGCGEVFVAAADEAATGVKATPPKPNVGASAKDKDKVSPKPMAKRPAPPPMDDDDEPDQRPVRSEARRDDDDMDDDDDRPSRSRGKSVKKSGSLLWLWMMIGGVVVIGGGLGAYFLFFSGPSGGGAVAKGKGNPNLQGQNNSGQGNVAAGNPSLAELVPGDAMFFASVNGELWNAKALDSLKPFFGKQIEQEFEKNTGIPLSDMQLIAIFSAVSFAEAQKNPQIPPVIIIAQTKKPLKQQEVTAAYQAGELGRDKMMALEFAGDQTAIVGAPAMLQIWKSKKGTIKATGVLERAIAQASASKGLVIAATIPPDVAQLAGPAAQMAPPTLLKVRSVFANLEMTDKLLLQVSLGMDDAATALQLKTDADKHLGGLPQLIDGFIKEPQAAKPLKQLLADLKVTAQDKELNIAFQADAAAVAMGTALLLPAIQKVRGAAGNAQDISSLKQIGLAWHVFHDVNKMLPPQTWNKGLSWRVAILPYIEQQNLFKMFKLDEPWDSPNNKKLIPMMPSLYVSTGKKAAPGFTYFQSFVGPKTVNANPMKGMRIQEIGDGSSNTLLVAEAAQAVEWTRPADINVAPNQPIVLGGSDPQGIVVLFADGSARRLPRSIDQNTWRLLIDPNDGMPVNIP